MLYPDSLDAAGDALGQHLAEGELNSLADMLEHAAEACAYAADDLDYRADYEQRTGADAPATAESDAADYEESRNAYAETGDHLTNLAAAIRLGEERYREDS